MAEMTQAQRYFHTPADVRHAPGSPQVVEGGFQCACRCGYPGKRVGSSPSHAYQATRVHAENENRRERGGGAVVEPENYSRTGEPPKAARPRPVRATVARVPGQAAPSGAPVGSPRASRTGAGTPCGCGCGDPSGGLFRPGHDSKLLSRLGSEVNGGVKTVADALAEMDQIGASDKLKAKFESRMNK